MRSLQDSWRKWGGSVKKYMILAGANLRRAKGQNIAIFVLVLLGSAMLNLWLMLATDYKQNFDRCHDRLHDGHVTLVVDQEPELVREVMQRMLDQEGEVTEYHLEDAMAMVGSLRYNEGEINTEFVILEKESALARPLGRVEIVEEGTDTSGIYLPLLYRTGDIAVGKEVEIVIGSSPMKYTVCGFFNSAMAGSHNCALCVLVLTGDKYQELKALGYAPEGILASVRLRDKWKSEEMEAALLGKAQKAFPEGRSLSNSYKLVTTSRYISQMICSAIVSVMAFFILFIALVVIASNIQNDIQENMRKLGVLKAVGYSSRQVILVFLLQFMGISLTGAVFGLGLSYVVFPAVNEMMMAQTGIPYVVQFLPIPCLVTLGILGGTVALAVWTASRRVRQIEPIVALRQGMQTHNFKKNHVPLGKTRFSLQPALALKTACLGIRQNITVGVTMLVLSLVVVFSGLMVENVIRDITPFIHLIVGETADSCIDIQPEVEEMFLRTVEEDQRVEKVYLYSTLTVSHVGGSRLMATLSEDFSKVNNQDVCIQGRFPKYENEVAIAAKYAREMELKVGDEIMLTDGSTTRPYLICGYTQISNNLGKDCLLTRQGYAQMGDLVHISYYLDLAEGTDIDAFHEDIKAQFGQEVNAVINIQSVLDGTTVVYVSLMILIVAAILVLSVLVIAFVLYLLVRMMLNRKKQEYGILKALGFTTGQLILQTALSFMPGILFSTVVGLVFASLVINPFVALFLRGIGIVKCTFTVPMGFIAMAGAGLVLAAFGIACLMSLRIKRISPRELLVEG